MLSSDKLLEKTNATSSKLLNPIVTERTGTQIILEEKPFMCAVCLKTFKQRTGIKNHIIHNKHILYVPNKTIPENLGIALPKKVEI